MALLFSREALPSAILGDASRLNALTLIFAIPTLFFDAPSRHNESLL